MGVLLWQAYCEDRGRVRKRNLQPFGEILKHFVTKGPGENVSSPAMNLLGGDTVAGSLRETSSVRIGRVKVVYIVTENQRTFVPRTRGSGPGGLDLFKGRS